LRNPLASAALSVSPNVRAERPHADVSSLALYVSRSAPVMRWTPPGCSGIAMCQQSGVWS
jgi:hypothetical protein